MNTSSNDGLKDGGASNESRYPTGEKPGIIPSYRPDISPDSTTDGSIGSSSAVSKESGAGKSVKSIMSLRSLKERPPPYDANYN